MNTFVDLIAGGCISCPKHSNSHNAKSPVDCMCFTGYYSWYNSKAFGGDMTFNEDEYGTKTMNHVFPTGEGSFTVFKTVMLSMTCHGDIPGEPMMYNPDTYPINIVDITCGLPFVISYEVDGIRDTVETDTFFQCKACPAGSYSDAQEVDACNTCSAGTYQDEEGATECKPCAAGSISNDSSVTCSVCGIGSYSLDNECQLCPQGTQSLVEGASACTACPENTWSDASSAGCMSCPPWSSSTGATGANGCLCFEGLYLYQEEMSLSCMQCPAGTYASQGANVCSPCPPGTYNDQMAMAGCVPCPATHFSPGGSTACVACILPQIPYANGSGCQDCPQGMVCQADGAVVTCPQGSYGVGTGLTSLAECSTCPPNHVCSDASTIEPCPAHTHSPAGATTMKDCVCDYGYDCSYTKSVKGKVVLPISSTDFDTMKAEFIKAIAESAGVSPDRVKIISVAQYAATGARRTMQRLVPKTQIQWRVQGVMSMLEVDKSLKRHGFPRALVKTKVTRDHHVDATQRPMRQAVVHNTANWWGMRDPSQIYSILQPLGAIFKSR